MKKFIPLFLLFAVFIHISCSENRDRKKLLIEIEKTPYEEQSQNEVYVYDSIGRLIEYREVARKRQIIYDTNGKISKSIRTHYFSGFDEKDISSREVIEFEHLNSVIIAKATMYNGYSDSVAEKRVDSLFLDQQQKPFSISSQSGGDKFKEYFEYDKNDNMIKSVKDVSTEIDNGMGSIEKDDVQFIMTLEYDSKHNPFAYVLPTWFKVYSSSVYFDFLANVGQNNVLKIKTGDILIQGIYYIYDEDDYIKSISFDNGVSFNNYRYQNIK